MDIVGDSKSLISWGGLILWEDRWGGAYTKRKFLRIWRDNIRINDFELIKLNSLRMSKTDYKEIKRLIYLGTDTSI